MSLPKLEPSRNVSSRVISNRIIVSTYYDMIALKQGNENPQNNIIASFSFASTGKCNSMIKSVGSSLRMVAFLPKRKKIAAEWTEKKKDLLYEEGLDRFN